MRTYQAAAYGQAEDSAQQRAKQATLQPKQPTGDQREDEDDNEAAHQGERGQVPRWPPRARRQAGNHGDRGQITAPASWLDRR